MRKRYSALCMIAALTLLCSASAAHAGKLYQLDFRVVCPGQALPLDVVVEVFENQGNSKGVSSTTFDGDSLLSYTNDAVASIVGVGVDGPNVFVDFVANGYDNGKFKSNSEFEVCINGVCSRLRIHTSCSQEIPFDRPLEVADDAVDFITGDCEWTATGGVGECLPGQPACPGDLSGDGNKLYELNGFFRVPLGGCTPGALTFTVEKDEGTSTATWTGSGLSDIVCDNVACLTDAYLDGDDLVVKFESSGHKSKGEFDKSTEYELDLGNCGAFKIDQHTSCSRAIILDTPLSLDSGGGSITYTDGCGGCVLKPPVAVEQHSWGTVKSKFKE